MFIVLEFCEVKFGLRFFPYVFVTRFRDGRNYSSSFSDQASLSFLGPILFMCLRSFGYGLIG